MSEKFTTELDCRGMNCPLPVIKTKKAMESLSSGEVLKLITSDPGSQRDIPAFCNRSGNTLLESLQEGQEFYFYLEKK